MKKIFGQLEVVLPKMRADAFCDWVRTKWGLEPVCLEAPAGDRSVVTTYFESPGLAQAHLRRLPRLFAISSAVALACHPDQWLTFWRHHFHVQDIGRRLRTVPVWEKAPDRRRINLRIDPGLSFGTGEHFTTRFCLEELERACDVLYPRSLLDAGTGSGLLAIAAAKLGVPRVEAFDQDPACLASCRRNASLNRLSRDRIRFYAADVLHPDWRPRPADVICANILSSVLMAAAPALWRAARRRLILSGIRETEGDAVAEAFRAQGASEVSRDGDGEWCGIVLDRLG